MRQLILSRLIRIYTVCHSALIFDWRPFCNNGNVQMQWWKHQLDKLQVGKDWHIEICFLLSLVLLSVTVAGYVEGFEGSCYRTVSSPELSWPSSQVVITKPCRNKPLTCADSEDGWGFIWTPLKMNPNPTLFNSKFLHHGKFWINLMGYRINSYYLHALFFTLYSALSLSRPRLSRITAYLEVKIWSLF